jgi:predicted outer membrane repeat protein
MAVIPNFSNHTFTRNTALKGGAVSALNNPLDSFKNNFTNNTASMGREYILYLMALSTFTVMYLLRTLQR